MAFEQWGLLPLDYVSFNLPVPRSRTRFRSEAIESQWIGKDVFVMDQSGKYTTMGNANLSAQELFKYRNLAYRKFYLRPLYILKKIFSVQTRDEWRMNLKNGFALLKESFGSYKDKMAGYRKL
ncbi:MAG: hypothetical protein HYY62_04900 [Deltaproteobacteria bacterium]|nr:hypothetical protein [Deltaproteobacteria bacterium]